MKRVVLKTFMDKNVGKAKNEGVLSAAHVNVFFFLRVRLTFSVPMEQPFGVVVCCRKDGNPSLVSQKGAFTK